MEPKSERQTWPPSTQLQPAFIGHLARLPRELVHQVLTDLPIVKILQILASKIPYLVDSVLSHINYQHFIKPEDVEETVSTFLLYREIMLFRGKSVSHDIYGSILARQYGLPPRNSWEVINLGRVQCHMIEKIAYEINHLQDLDWGLLRPFMSMPVTDIPKGNDIHMLRLRWEIIEAAKLKANAAKAAQLNASADLLAAFPGKLMLKKPRDPSQDGPRQNQKHIEDVLRSTARKALYDRKLVHGGCLHCSADVDIIELVPYDKHLWFFINTLERFPVEEPGIAADFDTISLAESEEKESKRFEYPSNIAKSIELVMAGLWNLYTDMPNPSPRVRIVEPQADDPKALGGRLNFLVSTEPHPKGLPEHLHRCRARKAKCYDEREYEWLRSFLSVVTWMEENVGT